MGECLKESYKQHERLTMEHLLNEEYNSKFPKISVIMSVFNTKEKWLRESIESILNQTFGNFEFIIINDGSTNNAGDVILSYKDERIVYIKQENQGLAKSLNNGLKIAKGEYIARMDSDDISLPERFEKQIEFLDTHKDISVLGSWFETFPKYQLINHPKKVKYLKLLQGCFIGHPTVMWRKADFDKYDLRYNPEYKCEDYELWSRAILYVNFANLQEVLLKYRWHENNLSKPTEEFISHEKKVKDNMLAFLTDDINQQSQIKQIIFDNFTLLERIFSVKNSVDNVHKLITILGIKIKIKRKIKYKIVKLMGGLGNQMFQYAFGKALEYKTNTKVLFDLSWFEDAKKYIVKDGHTADGVKIRPYDLDIFKLDMNFATAKQVRIGEKDKANEQNAFIYDKSLLNSKNTFFEGYYQNENYFLDISNIIKTDFIFPQINSNDEINIKLADKIKSVENPVFIHIRRGDYLNLPDWALSDNYYKKAVEVIKSKVNNPTFFIFGEDCEDFINNELKIDCEYEYIGNYNSEQGKDYIDMQLMSMCKHGIIANSTFSWWSAWLMSNKDKVIVAPTPWLNGNDEIVCNDWIKVEK